MKKQGYKYLIVIFLCASLSVKSGSVGSIFLFRQYLIVLAFYYVLSKGSIKWFYENIIEKAAFLLYISYAAALIGFLISPLITSGYVAKGIILSLGVVTLIIVLHLLFLLNNRRKLIFNKLIKSGLIIRKNMISSVGYLTPLCLLLIDYPAISSLGSTLFYAMILAAALELANLYFERVLVFNEPSAINENIPVPEITSRPAAALCWLVIFGWLILPITLITTFAAIFDPSQRNWSFLALALIIWLVWLFLNTLLLLSREKVSKKIQNLSLLLLIIVLIVALFFPPLFRINPNYYS